MVYCIKHGEVKGNGTVEKCEKCSLEKGSESIDKLSILFDYISEKTNDKEAGIICEKLGIDNTHISKTRSIEEYKKIIDKMILARNIIKRKI